MFQGHRQVLEGSVDVRLRKVACVACFRKKTDVGELQCPDHFRLLTENSRVRLLPEAGMDKQEKKKSDIAHQK